MRTSDDLELVHVTKRYAGGAVAVSDVSHLFKGGTYVCLLGPSGCGKSSTLRMMAGHETVSDGHIVLAGKEVTNLPPAKRGTAMMFQSYALFPHLNVTDNVAFSLKMQGIEADVRRKKAGELLDQAKGAVTPGEIVLTGSETKTLRDSKDITNYQVCVKADKEAGSVMVMSGSSSKTLSPGECGQVTGAKITAMPSKPLTGAMHSTVTIRKHAAE